MARKNQPTIFQRFFSTEAAGASVLVVFGVVALLLANSPFANAYEHLWQVRLTIGIAGHSLSLTLHQWIDDGLMAMFFLLVGLEIKRELIVGELASLRKAALPISCAVGGMIVPAALYLLCNMNGLGARGWAAPVATDIAFALGTLALIAPKAPVGARVFLAALAIVDDMGAVLIIAIFYSQAIAGGALLGAGVIIVILIGFNLIGVCRLWPYMLAGIALWYFIHESGVHATVAGVVLAFTIPMHTRINATQFLHEGRNLLDRFDRTETGDHLVLTSKGQQEALFAIEQASKAVMAPTLRLENALHNFSAFVVMPLFAFANAGVRIAGPLQHTEVTLGILLGLVLGKPLGVMAAAFGAVRLGVAQLPRGVGWDSLLGYACLAGIGFTMSLFIAMLAFDETGPVNSAKAGIIAGSLLAGIVGTVVLRVVAGFRNDQ
ncbi:MAG TPA: Na+/H+ antiporter NhaA [Candidatus Udaeobacter sp.]|nr:Na+/H+ antiporter NhaA [Candidatus Udaeobacter sp.]